jgi:beta-N-acetylglucosaminidase
MEFIKLSQKNEVSEEELDRITEGAEVLEEEGSVHYFK